ncbi:MAG: prepilin-type N-terminal cleavage/methylation domain-containing protein [Candidatus Omnitrophota bacterium]
MKHKDSAFTLLEIIVVVVILGILATLSVSQYTGARERALDREAQANLRLILAAERTYRMENASNSYSANANIAGINRWLKLLLPRASSQWDYFTRTYSGDTDFCAEAVRRNAGERPWRIRAPSADEGRSLDPQPEEGVHCP